MEVCSSGHEEICYSSRKCPLCESIEELTDFEKRFTELRSSKEDLEDELDQVKDDYNSLLSAVQDEHPEFTI